MSDITILIQGPLDQISLDHVTDYQKYGPVIVTHWPDDKELTIPSGCLEIKRDFPGSHTYTQETADRQFWGILFGLEAVETKYVIRTRSDEFWNLGPLVDAYIAKPSGILCGNIFFRHWSAYRYHPGDHVFIGETGFLTNIYKKLCSDQKYGNEPAEVALAKTALDVAELIFTEETGQQKFVEIFDVMDVNQMKPFLGQFKHGSYRYDSEFEAQSASCIKDRKGLL